MAITGLFALSALSCRRRPAEGVMGPSGRRRPAYLNERKSSQVAPEEADCGDCLSQACRAFGAADLLADQVSGNSAD